MEQRGRAYSTLQGITIISPHAFRVGVPYAAAIDLRATVQIAVKVTFILCEYGESNSSLILGKDARYHYAILAKTCSLEAKGNSL